MRIITDEDSTPKQMKAMAQVEDYIVPVRIDVEHDHYRFKDTFMWNCSGEWGDLRLFEYSMMRLCADGGAC